MARAHVAVTSVVEKSLDSGGWTRNQGGYRDVLFSPRGRTKLYRVGQLNTGALQNLFGVSTEKNTRDGKPFSSGL